MKEKKIIYILIPLVIIIWGVIFYKIYKNIKSKSNTISNINSLPIDTMKTNQETFKITGNYRDPFLNSLPAVPAKSAAIQPVKRDTEKWPVILYHGAIKSTHTDIQYAFVEINGQSYIITLGDEIRNVSIDKIFRDSIEVEFEKNKKIIKR